MDVDRLRALPGARRRLREDGRTAKLLSPRLHGQDSQLGCVWSSGTRFRPSRHAVPTAEQNQRHFRMLRGKKKLKKKPQQRTVLLFHFSEANRESFIFCLSSSFSLSVFFWQHLGQRTALLLLDNLPPRLFGVSKNLEVRDVCLFVFYV